jgi:hypothetical protein
MFPVLFAVLVWGGLWLRDYRVRNLWALEPLAGIWAFDTNQKENENAMHGTRQGE